MRQNICKLYYKGISDSTWKDAGMVPGSGSLSIDKADTKNGAVRTYRLNVKLYRDHPAGPSWLAMDLLIQVVYDDGTTVQLGTAELPIRLDVSGAEILAASCAWQDAA